MGLARDVFHRNICRCCWSPFLRRGTAETLRFEAFRQLRSSGPALATRSGRGVTSRVRAFSRPIRGRLLLVAMLWNCVGLSRACGDFFQSIRKRDHHWTSAQVGQAVVLSYVLGSFGICRGGMDARSSRTKNNDGALLCNRSGSRFLILFQSSTYRAMLTAMVVTVCAFKPRGARRLLIPRVVSRRNPPRRRTA